MSDQINSTEAALITEPAGGNAEQITQTTEPVVAPETLYEVKVNGQTIKVPIAELTGGYSRQSDYTKKTAELAEYRRTIDSEVAAHREQIEQVNKFFSDPRVQKALASLQAGITDPSQPLTVEQAQKLYESQSQHQNAALEQRMKAMAQDLEIKTISSHYETEIESVIKQALQKHPVLQDIDNVDYLLRQAVGARQPQTLDEAKRLFVEIAQSQASKLEARFQTQQKQAAAQQTRLSANGIEPPGGTSVGLAPEKKFKIGSNDLLQAAVADLTAASNKG